MSCSWTTETYEDPAVVAQINQNNTDINNYGNLMTKLSNASGIAEDCKSNVNCCYQNITLAISGTGVQGIFDNNIKEYHDQLDAQIKALDTLKSEAQSEITRLQNENAQLEKQRWKTRSVYSC